MSNPNPIDHLTAADLDAIGRELDEIRDRVMADLGQPDADYIRKVIKTQRGLEVGGRVALLASLFPPAWLAGTAMLSVAKILENMEIGHNVMHGQYDWMRDPEIHSTTWEWDSASTAESWKHSHNYMHHTFTNVLGKDRDLGYDVLRIDAEQPWHPYYLGQPVYNVLLALFFQWAVAIHDLELGDARTGRKPWSKVGHELRGMLGKARAQFAKDYLLFPLLSGPSAVPAFLGNLTANLTRNVWAHTIIFCGHFPDGAVTFDYEESDLDDEGPGDWYVRQLLGSCNIDGSPLLHLMSGNLSFQIEHHLFPDVPSSRYAEIAPQVRDLCERYELPYTSGPLLTQYAQVWRKILRLSLPGGGQLEAEPPEDGLVATNYDAMSSAVAPSVTSSGASNPASTFSVVVSTGAPRRRRAHGRAADRSSSVASIGSPA
jgi:NADPH-dependent stearoyl-CoA 9-desaturase